MNCRELRKLIEGYLDGTLDERERNALEKHLGTCARCARELQAFSQYREWIRSLPKVKAPDNFLARVKGRLQEGAAPEREPFGKRLGDFLFKPVKVKIPVGAAVAAAAAVALVVALNVVQMDKRGGEEAARRAPAEVGRLRDAEPPAREAERFRQAEQPARKAKRPPQAEQPAREAEGPRETAPPRDAGSLSLEAVSPVGEEAPPQSLQETGSVEGTSAARGTDGGGAAKDEGKRREVAFTLKVRSGAPTAVPLADRGAAAPTQVPEADRSEETEIRGKKSASDRGPRKAGTLHAKKAKKSSEDEAFEAETPEGPSLEGMGRKARSIEEQGSVEPAPAERSEGTPDMVTPDAVLDRVKTLIEDQGGRVVASGLPGGKGADAEPVTLLAEVPAAGLDTVIRELETFGELEGPRSRESLTDETAEGTAAPDTLPAVLVTVTIVF